MADNLIQKPHKTSEKNKYNNVVHRTTSESIRLNESEKGVTHPTSLQSAHNPRKISSFQITSVTVGSRVSTDAGDDSADDLDESHTDDISRVTDIENETPSYSEDTFSKDDVFYNASSASLGCAPVIPTSSQYGLAIVGQDTNTNQIGAVPNSNNTEVNDMHVSVTNAGTGSIINLIGNSKPQEGMKEIQEHVRNERFKVVKIESTEPFRRGRWMCMDYLDHTTTQQNAPITLNNNLDVTETNNLQAPDSGVVMNDNQHDDMCNDLGNKGPKDQVNSVQQMDQNIQKQFPMASPGQSLTQPINIVQQQMPVNQSVSVQSPPLELPQQMPNQNQLQSNQQVGQQHPQSMTHITLQNTPQSHAQPPQQQQVQQIPQSFPQHQLQQVIAQSQGIAMQQIPMHQQLPQQMQQIPNQQMQQMGQHLPPTQLTNMQIQQQMPQMQGIPNQGQLTQVPGQQAQLQQIQMQPIQGQPNPQQIHQMQQAQIPNIGQSHHLQGQQTMGQQAQLQHLSSQAQMQALNQQMPNHMQQMQIPTQLTATNQQISQMQTQMHQLPSQPQQSVVPGIHPQMQQQGIGVPQPQYNQTVNQQPNQSMISGTLPSSQQPMVQQQHSVPQYHTQQSQMTQQGQTLPQEVLTSIVTSQQGATLPSNLQPMATQPQGSTLPANLQSLAGQQQQPVHMAPQQGTVPQGNIQMMTATPQSMQMTLDNQTNMQIPASDPIFMQPGNVGQQIPSHMTQPQNMMQQQAQGQMGGVQYVPNQAVPQVSMAHQNIPMSMQQTMPVGMGGAVHANVVQSQTNMALGYGGVVPVMSQSSVAPVEATVSGTNSPVVSMPVSSTAYVGNAAAPVHDSQGFGSPVSAVVSHAISSAVINNVNVNACDSGAPEVAQDGLQVGDTGDGKDEPAPPPEDER